MFKVVNGICRPQDAETLGIYQNIQRQANRFLDQANKSLITIDGRIGPKTLAAVNFALLSSAVTAFFAGGKGFADCSSLAENANRVLDTLTNMAESKNLSVVADPDNIIRSVLDPPSKLDVATGRVVHPSPIRTAGVAGIPFWLIGVAGVGVFYVSKKGKSKKKRKALSGRKGAL